MSICYRQKDTPVQENDPPEHHNKFSLVIFEICRLWESRTLNSVGLKVPATCPEEGKTQSQ